MVHDIPVGDRSGTCAFRLMPTDELADAPSMVSVSHAAGGRAALLTYAWTHPDDGDQAGTLMVGTADDAGVLTAAWVDSWHQPTVALLTGRDGIVGYEYAPGWRWEVEVTAADGVVSMVMHNVVPERESEPAVRYDVMRASWS
jgi:hypothetical protein